jgi:hypothetical protein
VKRQFYCIPLLIAIFCHLASCSHQPINEKISGVLQISSIPNDALVEYEDTHGGFHGDGQTFAKFVLDASDAKNILKSLTNHPNWRKLPLSENLNLIIYGGEKDGVEYCHNFAEKLGIPHLETGYWFFFDRHSKSTCPESDIHLFERSSFNFTLALYDPGAKTIYYLKYDT